MLFVQCGESGYINSNEDTVVSVQCGESGYINSRPFRVNAGPVHAYCATPKGKTAYLCELKAGAEVVVAAADGTMRTAIVGRCKVQTSTRWSGSVTAAVGSVLQEGPPPASKQSSHCIG